MSPSRASARTVSDSMRTPVLSLGATSSSIACMIEGTPAITMTLPIQMPGAPETLLSTRSAPSGMRVMRRRASFISAPVAASRSSQDRERARIDVDRDPEGLGDAIGGDVVVGRADAAGGEDVGVAVAQRVERIDDRRLLVADHAHLPEVDAERGQVLGDIADVLVLGAPGQDLVADHQQGGGDGLGRRGCSCDVMATHCRREHGDRSRMIEQGRPRCAPPHSLVGRPILPLWVMMHQAASRAFGLGTSYLSGRTRMHAPAPLRPIAYGRPRIVCERTPDGSLRCRSAEPLAPHDPSLARLFRAAVERNPDGPVPGRARRRRRLAQAHLRRRRGNWSTRIAQGLLERGLSAERPVMILSGNGIDHALLTLAGHTAGVPVAPISVAYSLQSQDHAKLKHIADPARARPDLRRRHRRRSPKRSPRST